MYMSVISTFMSSTHIIWVMVTTSCTLLVSQK